MNREETIIEKSKYSISGQTTKFKKTIKIKTMGTFKGSSYGGL